MLEKALVCLGFDLISILCSAKNKQICNSLIFHGWILHDSSTHQYNYMEQSCSYIIVEHCLQIVITDLQGPPVDCEYLGSG